MPVRDINAARSFLQGEAGGGRKGDGGGICKVVMRVKCLPNCGELFADFWRPQRLVDMKSSNAAVNDEL